MFATSRWQPSLPNEGSHQHFNNHSDDPWTFITFPSCDDHARIIETSRGINRKVIWKQFFPQKLALCCIRLAFRGLTLMIKTTIEMWLCQVNIASNQLELPIVPPSSNPQKTRGQIPVVNPPPFQKTCCFFLSTLSSQKNTCSFQASTWNIDVFSLNVWWLNLPYCKIYPP